MQQQEPSSIKCLLCDGATSKWLTATNKGVGPKGIYNIYRCARCFSTVIDPIPVDLDKFYRDYHAIPSGANWERAVKACKNRLAVLHSIGSSSTSILDIGAGAGAFVDAANQAGHLALAIEQDENCRTNMESIIPGRVTEDLAGFTKSNFPIPDIVTLWHVFEHIPNPGNFISQICQTFPSRTKIIIEVPNADSWLFKIMGSKWPHLDAPRHVFLPTQKGIQIVAQQNGMKVLQIRNRDNGAWGAFSISHFGNRVGEGRANQIFRRLIQIILTPLFLLEPQRSSCTSTYVLSREV